MLERLRKWVSGLNLDVIEFDTYDRYHHFDRIIVTGETRRLLWDREIGSRFIIDANGQFIEMVVIAITVEDEQWLRWTAENAESFTERHRLKSV